MLQALNENALSLRLLVLAQTSAAQTVGPTHIQNGQALHQLAQAYFLAGDISSALATSERAFAVFEQRLGADHGQTREMGKNVELLRAVVENVERQKEAGKAAKERQTERLRLVQAKVAGSTRGRLASAGQNVEAGLEVEASRIGERGHLDVDELVRFIQGPGKTGGGARGKNSLRGKRRTGAKR